MDSYYKLRQLFYYKVRHGLLQIATGITKCDDYYKLRQYKNSFFQFCLTITKPFPPFYLKETTDYSSLVTSRNVSQLIMQVSKPKVFYLFYVFNYLFIFAA